jgi:hypothetical protein
MSRRVLLLLALLPGLGGPARAATSGSGLPVSEAVLTRRWTASWITCPGAPERDPGVLRFRKALELGAVPARFIVHVSADQRFVLHANGRRVGIGPSRGDIHHWRFETFDLAPFLKPGMNLLVATVWSFGGQAPLAQVTERTGLVVQGDTGSEHAANTGASWQCAPEPGHQPWPEGMQDLKSRKVYVVVGPGERLDAARYDWDWARPPEAGGPEGRWRRAQPYDEPSPRTIREGPGYDLSPAGRLMVPDPLPPMEYRPVPAGAVVRASGTAVASGFPESPTTVSPHAKATILLDRRELVAAYPELRFSGGRGSRLRVSYQEALVKGERLEKGNRNEIDGKRLVGYSDEIVPDGGRGRVFHPLWWRTWRFLQVDVETAAEPLVLEGLRAHATGYPFEEKGGIATDDPALSRVWETGWRTARLCAHETYVDCPYYEQLQYAGDTRIQALVSYAVSGDDRLARQAIEAFDQSRRHDGIVSSRYPTAVPHYIPPFSLLWVGMVHDFWMHRDDPGFVRARLAGTRTALDWFLERQRPDGLLGRLEWWPFLDWASDFAEGVAPQEADGQSVALTLQMAIALREAAELEGALGDPHRAEVYRASARRAAEGVRSRAWDGGRGLVADRPARDHFSQQTNILAVLADAVPPGAQSAVLDRVLAAGTLSYRDGASIVESKALGADLTKASYYFRFYLARALEKTGRAAEYLAHLEPWREMLDLGLSTWAEMPDTATRSDCHAWSAHPNYDLLRLVAGIKPGSPGFRTVRIEPRLGTLGRLEARMPHPRGEIAVAYRRDGTGLEARVTLPPGLEGALAWCGRALPLRAGSQSFRLD